MKRLRIIVIFLILAAAVSGTLYYRQHRPQTDPGILRVSGNIEVTQVQLSFRLPGWLKERCIDEGYIVTQDQVAARLDDTELTQEVQRNQARVDSAEAALAELQAGSRPEEIAAAQAAQQQAQYALEELLAGSRPQEIAAAQAMVQRARAEVEFWETDFQRMKDSVSTGAVSQDKFDSSRMSLEVARAKADEAAENLKLVQEGPRAEAIDQARAALARAQQQYLLIQKGPRVETIDQAHARLEEARQTLAQAKTRLSYATLTCPVPGVVLSKNVESGEFVAAGTPIVTLGNLKDIWLRAYIVGPDLGRVKIGQPVRVYSDSYPDKVYDGRISFIASEAEFTPKSVQTYQERVKLVYRIKIDIDNPDMELKPGMPADADIVLNNSQS